MSERNNTDLSSAIAIVGMAGRFPGSRNVRQFWRNLRNGVESIRFFSRQQLLERGVPANAIDEPDYVPANGMLDGIELFDAGFFGIPPREAEIMDPQHRFLLECAWEVLEDAGYVPENCEARIGIFAGVGASSYLIRNILPNHGASRIADELSLLMGNSKDFAVTRIAYKLNLRGPAINVNTACSSGLVAVHLACQSLIDWQCDLAIAGGVGIQVPQDTGYQFQINSIASPDGHCRAFDASAAGTVHGNGVGLVALKRLEAAIEARDHICAIILGSAVNNDGAGKVGYTAPGCDGQAGVIAEALSVAECAPETISYVEAHGTGTRLGDPVEIAALRRAFGMEARRQYCAIGSVKTNVGHLDEAAGVTGLIKTALALEHRQIPPSLHFHTPNPEIDFAASPFFVNRSLTPWPDAGTLPRRAGVSSFGIGGTNAHAVLQEAPSQSARSVSRSWQVPTLSARSVEALRTMPAQLADVLETETEIELSDAAFTLHTGRRNFEYRMAVVCRDRQEAVRTLREDPSRQLCSGPVGAAPPVAFLFSGQGSQYAGMGRDLYESEPVFRDSFNECATILKDCLHRDICDVVFSSSGKADGDARLRDTQLAQPCLFAFEYALARLWMSFGIKPAYLGGHSVGEYTAAHFAGVMTLEDTLRLLAERGRLMHELPEGTMLAVSADAAELSAMLNGSLSIAAMNAPGLSVVAGETSAIADLENRLSDTAMSFHRLATSHAFHSPMMAPVVEPFRAHLATVKLSPPRSPFVSNLTGEMIQPGEAVDAAYWCRHLQQSVNFTGCLDRLAEIPNLILLEVGPGEALKTIARRHPAWKERNVLHSVRHPRIPEHDSALLLRTLGELWTKGVAVDWPAFHAHEKLHRVSLPTYPFEGKRYWIDEPRPASAEKTTEPFADWLWTPQWRSSPWPPQNQAQAPMPWLVFGPDDQRTDAIVSALREQSAPATRARIEPSTRDSFVAELARHPQPQQLLYRAESGITGLLFLAQALGELQWSNAELTILTEELYAVDGTEQLQPDHALAAGAAQTIPLELPVRCRSIDLGRNCPLHLLVRELRANATDRPVALRGELRFTREFVPHAPAEPSTKALRERGVYLITGGFGSMGLAFAKLLATEVRARLILVGRRGLPPRETWQTLMGEGPVEESTRRTRQTIERIREIERLGSEVMLVNGDVSDPACLREICERAQAAFGPLNGIVHTAGILGQGMIRARIPASVEAVLAPKVAPLRTLEEIFGHPGAGDSLDFLILCSSSAAIAPIVGQFDYAAANAWLDAFAHYASSRYGWRTISIDWNFWQELGMIEQARSSQAEKQAILNEIRDRGWSEAGIAVFKKILMHFRGAQVLVSPEPVHLLQQGGDISHSLLQERVELPEPLQAYSGMAGPATNWEIGEHRPGGVPVLPGTTYLEMAVTAFERATGRAGVQLRDVFFPAPMVFGETETREMRVVLKPSNGSYRFLIMSRTQGQDDVWIEHAHGEIEAAPDEAPPSFPVMGSPSQSIDFALQPDHPLAERQRTYSPRWQCLKTMESHPDGLMLRANLPEEWADEAGNYWLHPALLDAIVGASALHEHFEDGLPFSYGRVRIYSRLPASCVVFCRYCDVHDPESFTIDLVIADPTGHVCLEIENYTMRRIRESTAMAARAALGEGENRELVQHSSGSLSSLELRTCPRTAPGPAQVEIEVYAAGLNFIEVLFALGMLPQFEGRTPVRFGLECSGVVTRVGSGVTGLAAGDEVMAFSESSFSRYALAESHAVRLKPQRLSFEAAATIPAAFCTAWYALVTKGGLKQGEKVLIHSASGGVGMAALQIARWIGAEIFATAGSDEKRTLLRELGAAHTMNSRTLDFALEIQRLTQGRGVDVVLNSLSGDFQSRSLECLAPYGRFLEVGKRDFASGRLLNLAPFAKKLSFFAIDVGTDLPGFAELWTEVASHIDRGDFGPLPSRIFPIEDVATAFDFMAQAKHRGKIVIGMRNGTEFSAAPGRRAARTFASIVGPPLFSEEPDSGVPAPPDAVSSTRHARPMLAVGFRAPSPGVEAAIACIWEELLGIAPVGGDDNFFELRGDSLLAAQVFSRLYRTLSVKLPLNAVFEAPTPGGLAALVERQRAAARTGKAHVSVSALAEEEGEL